MSQSHFTAPMINVKIKDSLCRKHGYLKGLAKTAFATFTPRQRFGSKPPFIAGGGVGGGGGVGVTDFDHPKSKKWGFVTIYGSVCLSKIL